MPLKGQVKLDYQKKYNQSSKGKEALRKYRQSEIGKIAVKITHIKALLKHKFGLTMDKYNEMHIKQNGKCAICNQSETNKDRHEGKIIKLSVDHDHETGQLRELLCGNCNRALGLFQDNPLILLSAIEYLNRHTL